jgi:2-polyprenyl-3-methyl-5-hydroxy-6-metoxy-1,4-benzoquinol methylase
MLEKSAALPPGYNPNAPLVTTVRISHCPVCGSDHRSEYGSGYDYEMETCRNLWDFYQCADCEAVWIDPRPSNSELSTIYPPTYYAYDMSERLSPFILKGKAFLDRLKLDGIIKRMEKKPTSYLDVGCGDGRYLRQFAKQGMPKERIYGMDLPSPALPKLRADGFRIWEGRVEDCTEIAPGTIDLITMFHVIEHVENPIAVMKKLTSWLSPGGVLALETPNTDSIDRRLFSGGWWGGLHTPRHWTLFNAKSITRAVEKVELEPLGIFYQTGHSFWLHSLHHGLRYNSVLPMPKFAQWFNPMKSRLPLMAATGFDIFRRTLGAKTSAMLVLARKTGVSAQISVR